MAKSSHRNRIRGGISPKIDSLSDQLRHILRSRRVARICKNP